MVSFDVSGKVAVITGGAGILCSVMAKELAEFGVKIALLDIDEKKASEIAAEINEKAGGNRRRR